MRKSRLLPYVSLVLFALPAPRLAMAQEAPAPGEVRVTDLSYRGSGCPRDSVDWVLAIDGHALSVLFSRFTAEDGPDVASPNRRKACRITVDLTYPAGWQYAIYKVDYRGGAVLAQGGWGRQQARLHIRGAGAVPSHMRIDGPYFDDYVVSSRLEPNPRAWSQCRGDGTLTIDTSIHVKAPRGSSALMTVDSVDGVVEQTYNIEWRRCRR